MNMRNLVFFLIMTAGLVAGGSGYILSIDAPEKVQAGVPLLVTGNTTFPAGTEFDLVLYRLIQPVPEVIERRIIIVDETKAFSESFSTLGLESGQYKVEVSFPSDKGTSLGSGSTTLKMFNIVDRSDEIRLTVPTEQTVDDALVIKGYLPDSGVVTINIKVTGPSGFTAPAQDIRTTIMPGKTDGQFSRTVKVTVPGNYYATFSDARGYMSTIKFTVTRPPTLTQTTVVPTENMTEQPTATAASFPVAGLAGGFLAAAGLAYLKRR